MFWANKKRDKKRTLVFRTKNGIRRSKPQNVSSERTDSDCIENQIAHHSESERDNSEGEYVNG